MKNKVYGIGIADLKDSKCYPGWKSWLGILKRVSQGKGKYKDVTICDSWLTFSNFNSWYEKNHVPSWHIDKDLLGHKLYSPETCVYLPKEINYLLIRMKPYKKTKDGYIAKWREGSKVVYSDSIRSKEDAIKEHVLRSLDNMRFLISIYRFNLSKEILTKLLDYNFLEE